MQAIVRTPLDGAMQSNCKHATASACCPMNIRRRPWSESLSYSLPDTTIETIAPTGYETAIEEATDLHNADIQMHQCQLDADMKGKFVRHWTTFTEHPCVGAKLRSS
jgi:hypothetical protein